MRYRFGGFELDAGTRRFRHRGRNIHLQPRVFALLEYLVSHAERAVSRDELMEQLWRGVRVEDDSITRAVRGARAALAAEPSIERALEVVRGFGYRFTARVTVVDDEPMAFVNPADAPSRPFVGRETELHAIVRAFEAASAGERRCVFVRGEPGSGKSALVGRALAKIRGDAHVIEGQSLEGFGIGTPYLPLLEALLGLAQSKGGAVAEELMATIERVAPSWIALLPTLFVARPLRSSARAESSPAQMARELIDLVESIARGEAIVLVLEDLHWSDPATLEIVAALMSRRVPARLLVVCTARSNEPDASPMLEPVWEKLSRRDSVSEIVLRPLPPAAIARYLHEFPPAGETVRAEPHESITAWLHRRSEGLPLFLVELVDHLASLDLLDSAEPSEAPPLHLARLEAAGLPDTLSRALARRIEALGETSRRFLEAAAVAGFEFDTRLIEAVLRWPRDAIEQTTDALCGRGWLRFVALEDWPDGSQGARLQFTHALHADALQQTLPASLRGRFHRDVARRLARGFPSVASRAAEIVYHFERAGLRKEAMPHRVQSALFAASYQPSAEALTLAESAMKELSSLPIRGGVRARAECDLEIAIALSRASAGGFADESVERSFRRAYALAREVGDSDREVASAWGFAASLQMRGELEHAREITERLLSLVETAPYPEHVHHVHALLSVLAYFQGRFADCLAHGRASLAASDQTAFDALPRHSIQDSRVTVGLYNGLSQWHFGDAEAGRRLIESALDRACALAHPFTEAFAWAFAAIFAFRVGDRALQRERARHGRTIAEAAGIALWREVSRFMEICADPVDGPALDRLRETLRAMAGSGGLGGTFFVGLLAEIELEVGSRENVRTLCTIGLAMADRTSENNNRPTLHLAAARAAEEDSTRSEQLALAREWARRLGSVAFEDQIDAVSARMGVSHS